MAHKAGGQPAGRVRRRCCWSPVRPDLSVRMWSRGSTRPAGPMSPSTIFSGSDGKWRNLAKRQIADFVPPKLFAWLDSRKLDAVIHLGAISDTTATDGDLVMDTNFRLSMRLLDWCTATKTPFIYASSAATYGDGTRASATTLAGRAAAAAPDESLWLEQASVRPRGGRSRQKREKMPPQWAGLKFFNVFGPNEYHKGAMASVLCKVFDEAKSGKPVRLFKSHRDGIADGDQRRDFIYVDDTVAVMRWLLATPSVSGIFNVGTGKARSFKDMIDAMFSAMGQPNIEYIDMPASIRDQYQYFTESDVGICAAPATTRASRRLKKRSGNTSPAFSTSPTATGEQRKDVRP